jgi:hypothetical protein
MITENKLDKVFGPAGTSAGTVLLIVGIVITMNSLIGLVMIVLGAFIGFSSTSTLIDDHKKRVKFSNNIFGVIPSGKWLDINSEMKLGLKRSNITYRTYSRSNQSNDVSQNDLRIYLYSSDGKQLMPLKKFDSQQSAQTELKEFATKLDLDLI